MKRGRFIEPIEFGHGEDYPEGTPVREPTEEEYGDFRNRFAFLRDADLIGPGVIPVVVDEAVKLVLKSQVEWENDE